MLVASERCRPVSGGVLCLVGRRCSARFGRSMDSGIKVREEMT